MPPATASTGTGSGASSSISTDRVAPRLLGLGQAAVFADAPEVHGDKQREHQRQNDDVENVEAQQSFLADAWRRRAA